MDPHDVYSGYHLVSLPGHDLEFDFELTVGQFTMITSFFAGEDVFCIQTLIEEVEDLGLSLEPFLEERGLIQSKGIPDTNLLVRELISANPTAALIHPLKYIRDRAKAYMHKKGSE